MTLRSRIEPILCRARHHGLPVEAILLDECDWRLLMVERGADSPSTGGPHQVCGIPVMCRGPGIGGPLLAFAVSDLPRLRDPSDFRVTSGLTDETNPMPHSIGVECDGWTAVYERRGSPRLARA